METLHNSLVSTWRALQAAEITSYRESFKRRGDYFGFFSIPGLEHAERAGATIAKSCPLCLDIGCGVLPRPSYMQTKFMGLDPFFGEGPRQFPFTQAIGEHLPFLSASFPCVSFMSTIDHQIDPLVSLREAWRVLQLGGFIWLWLELRSETDGRYWWWKQQPLGTLFDDHHQHAFIKADIEELFRLAGFRWLGMDIYPGTYQWPPTALVLGEKP
jgi:SAM-dependent methyltransferase